MGAALPLWQSDMAAAARAEPPPPLFLIKGGKLEFIEEPPAEAEVLDISKPDIAPAPEQPIAAAKTAGVFLGRKWLAAIAVSCVLHAGIAAFFLHLKDDGVKIAGGEQAGIQVTGNAAEDQRAAGDLVDPSEVTNVTLVTMLDARPEAQPVETLAPVGVHTRAETAAAPAAERLQPVEEVAIAEPVEPLPATPVKPSTQVPVTEATPAKAPLEELAVARKVETAPSAAVPPIGAIEPIDEESSEQPLQSMEEKVSEVAEAIAALEDVPVPASRPTPPRKVKKTEAAPKPAKAVNEARSRQPAKPKAGSGGRNQADAKRGSEGGAAEGQTAARSKGAARKSAAGNAAVSNYPGKIVSRLRRALRYPAAAKRQRLRGEAHVQFTVSANGGVGSVRVVRSSGSPVLDNAALETVRRAAPFPAIPPEADRSNWPFTVPLAFVR